MAKLFTNKGGLLKILDAYEICMYIHVCRHEEFVLQVICINNCGYGKIINEQGKKLLDEHI